MRFLPVLWGSAIERTERRARRLVRRSLRQAWTISLPASAKPSASSRERKPLDAATRRLSRAWKIATSQSPRLASRLARTRLGRPMRTLRRTTPLPVRSLAWQRVFFADLAVTLRLSSVVDAEAGAVITTATASASTPTTMRFMRSPTPFRRPK